MRATFDRLAIVISLVAASLLATSGASLSPAALAAQNTQNGENNAKTDQSGNGDTGDAVAGQVLGGTGGGDTSVDATNVSRDVDVRSGDADGANTAFSHTGEVASESDTIATTSTSPNEFIFVNTLASATTDASNTQTGDNDFEVDQSAAAASGDAVGGQVIGTVTPAGGSADVVASNTSEDIDATTGDAAARNLIDAFTGLRADPVAVADATGDAALDVLNLSSTAAAIAPETVVAVTATAAAHASAANTQGGPTDSSSDNEASASQDATANTGDGVGGQVIGLVAAGDTSVDAKNSSNDVDVDTGDATSDNALLMTTGLRAAPSAGSVADASGQALITSSTTGAAPIFGPEVNASATSTVSAEAENTLDGDNTASVDQTAASASGDGVGGQVIGAVTSAGGSADIVADNTSDDVDASTGDASSTNSGNAFTGLAATALGLGASEADATFQGFSSSSGTFDATGDVGATAISDVTGTAVARNTQTDDNELSVGQATNANTGDGVAGQVIGVVSAGDTSVDAKNSSSDVDVVTGDAEASNVGFGRSGPNAFALGAGLGSAEALSQSSGTAGAGSSIFPDQAASATIAAEGNAESVNTQTGENNASLDQSGTATSGDGVGGQVIGSVTSAGGSADVVADNTSEDVDIITGDASAISTGSAIAGPTALSLGAAAGAGTATAVSTTTAVGGSNVDPNSVADTSVESLADASASNDQTGDNDTSLDQSADASSGDGVGGEVIGLVSGGDTSVDARNRSEDVDIHTGDATSANDGIAHAGPLATAVGLSLASGEASAVSSQTAVDATLDSDVTGTAVSFTRSDASATNEQLDDNDVSVDQSAGAASGDGVGGQVIGSVTSAGGSADVVADNTSEDVDVDTGNADATNHADAFAGLDATGVAASEAASTASAVTTASAELSNSDVSATAVAESDAATESEANNFQDGENSLDVSQSADAASGDGVGGEVIGLVSDGDTSVDAKNRSEDVDIRTGNATSDNHADPFVGLEAHALASNEASSSATAVASGTGVGANFDVSATAIAAEGRRKEPITADASNHQSDDNAYSVDQAASATSGDGVGGQVVGYVTGAGGSADIVTSNVSEDADVLTGNTVFTNDDDAFVGLQVSETATGVSTSTAIDRSEVLATPAP